MEILERIELKDGTQTCQRLLGALGEEVSCFSRTRVRDTKSPRRKH